MAFYKLSGKYPTIYLLTVSLCVLTLPLNAFTGEQLTIAGTGSALGSISILKQAFEKSHPSIKVNIVPSLGSTGGIRAVAKKAVDIGISSRVLNDEESKFDLSVIEYARSPLIFVTNINVPLSNVSPEDIVKIYSGEMKYWSDGQRIRISLRQHNETDIRIAKNISADIGKAIDLAFSRPGILIALTDQDNASVIEKIPGAFGISTLTQVVSEKRRLKVLSYNNVSPSIKNIAAGSYPLTRSYFTVTRKDLSPAALDFLTFMGSAQGRIILEENGILTVTR